MLKIAREKSSWERRTWYKRSIRLSQSPHRSLVSSHLCLTVSNVVAVFFPLTFRGFLSLPFAVRIDYPREPRAIGREILCEVGPAARRWLGAPLKGKCGTKKIGLSTHRISQHRCIIFRHLYYCAPEWGHHRRRCIISNKMRIGRATCKKIVDRKRETKRGDNKNFFKIYFLSFTKSYV